MVDETFFKPKDTQTSLLPVSLKHPYHFYLELKLNTSALGQHLLLMTVTSGQIVVTIC